MEKFIYTKENPLRVFTAFSGYDSQCMALDRLGIPYVLVGWSEIDKIQAAGISESQQYKMAGNSIVVACMEGIFRNLFSAEEKEQEGQLTLF